MKRFRVAATAAVLILPCLFSATAAAQAIKGANWLRTDHNYSSVPANDTRRVGWNLEFARDVPAMSSWGFNYNTLNSQHGIKTLFRIGFDAKPTAAEKTLLGAATFTDCNGINGLMNALDAEAGQAGNATAAAVGGYLLGNEVNLAEEWGIGGRAYGRVYKCYMTRWNAGPRAARNLFASGPGGCLSGTCPTFYSEMFDAMGSAIDGFAIHAYGQTDAAFDSDFRWQVNAINAASNTAVRNRPVYITEFNAGARFDQPLPVSPTAAYFNGVLSKVRDFNAANGNQIKAVMYFVDSPSTWVRRTAECHPAVAPQTGGWWRSSLCYSGTWRQYWLDSQPSIVLPPRNASVSYSGIPAFMMPGDIRRFSANVTNTGAETWTGSGSANWFRFGAVGVNGFTFSAFPQCGGYANSVLDARIYTCGNVGNNQSTQYQVDARAPTSGSSATFHGRMVRDGVEWFGASPQQAVSLGQAYCGTALSQCILNARSDILPFYQGNGWNTACWNRDAIVANWCGIDPAGCNALKSSSCATFNNSCRCSGGTHLGGAAIDSNGTYCGFQHCGTTRRIYTCSAGNIWSDTGRSCN
ncbi:MAG TPA: hypothetical protein VLF18_09430 [Tahibacter sp.]|uniref:hypothetical protein n=1 Tax=Tahibacter sp. TaxID=2056211 RepID=UPI002D0A15E6|nr:hypothetical protein [Tahibacter sp.]HSX60406.1 hypothetical protein [Tahibacter sp.]